MLVVGLRKTQQYGPQNNEILMKKKLVTIALEDMSFYAFHGVYPQESKVGRRFIISVFLECELEVDGSDRLSETFNYEWIYEIVESEMSKPRKLLETVAFHIANRLRSKSSVLQSGLIVINKEGLPLGGKIGRSSISYPI